MINKQALQFLTELKKNNNRDWFTANKSRYEEVKAGFEYFINALISQITKFDKSIAHLQAKNCMFRIYRDVRFSKDKSPYKTHFGAHITSAEKKSNIHSKAGYYIHIEPGSSMLAGGAYMPESDWLQNIRNEIHLNGKQFKKIIGTSSFKKYFNGLEGEKLKRPPQGFDTNHPDIELLKHKSFLAVHKVQEHLVVSDKFLKHCSEVFMALYPFDNFLNHAHPSAFRKIK